MGDKFEGFVNDIDPSLACTWVDPLDGTKDFVRGDLEHVTTMIGITVNEKPHVGIISQPFVLSDNPEEKYQFKPRIYFAVRPLKEVFVLQFDKEFSYDTPLELLKPKKH